ncbi:SgcJ/EcaC family oxidoreductase [Sphingopyxis sp. YR583]|uniref:SgcJ/EcaC family oxidoreductase n=1 Tax=Sphingopyxis sp. YR583 TaxID=1881047 RepID=UPI000B874342|nr:SgcJ/EcaC family oxidoreductase [Sphingopyxis sp. YR583]
MDRRQALWGLAAASVTVGTAQGIKMTGFDLKNDVARLAVDYADAWNASDMGAMTALYTDDVHWVNIVGMHWRGKAEVDKAHRIFFDIMFKGVPLALEDVESIVELPGEAAVAVIRWSVGAFTNPAGESVPPSRDRMTLVLVREGGKLLIKHGANIQINELAQKSDPVTPSGGYGS